MPSTLVPHANIPALAARVTPEMLKVLRRIRKDDFISNRDEVDQNTGEIVRRLAEFGLIDPEYDGDTSGPPSRWVVNGNIAKPLCCCP